MSRPERVVNAHRCRLRATRSAEGWVLFAFGLPAKHRITSSNDTGDRHRRIPVFVAPSARVRVATSSVMALMPPTEELARLWRRELFCDCWWSICATQSGVLGYVAEGEAGGRFVVADRWPARRAYMKPRRRDPDLRRARAAREKICADLAYEVRCRVPPVVLLRREGDPSDEERVCCVSLVMY